jgi:MFS family permease
VPLIATLLITAYGWRNSYLIIGTLALVIFVAVAQVLSRDPQGSGLRPDGDSNESYDDGNRSREESVTLKAAARTRQFWILCVAEFAIFFCLLTVIVHIVPHAMDLELAPPTAVGVLSTIGCASMLGRIVIGTANDKIGGKRSLVICFILLLCGLVWLHMASEAWMLFLFAVIYGFAHGGFFTVISPTIAELFGTGSHGVLFGIVLASGTIGGAAGPLMAGRTFDVTGSYRNAFYVLILLAVIGFVLITLLKPPRQVAAGR